MDVVRHNYIGSNEPSRRRKPDVFQEHVDVRSGKARSPVFCADGQKDQCRLIIDEEDASGGTTTLQRRLHNSFIYCCFISAVISTDFIVVWTRGSSSLPHADCPGVVGTSSRSSKSRRDPTPRRPSRSLPGACPTDPGCCETDLLIFALPVPGCNISRRNCSVS